MYSSMQFAMSNLCKISTPNSYMHDKYGISLRKFHSLSLLVRYSNATAKESNCSNENIKIACTVLDYRRAG